MKILSWRTIPGLVALVILTGAVYYPVVDAGYILDDRGFYITDPLMDASDGLQRIWFQPKDNNGIWPYLPLTRTSFWLDRQLWGLDLQWTHLLNVAFHLGGAVILWLALKSFDIRGAWLIGAIFVVHPVYVQSVAWIAQRKNVLAVIFYLLAIWSYLQFSRQKWWSCYVMALVLFICALLSKTSTVMLPLVLALCHLWLYRSWKISDLVALIPFFFASIGAAYSRIWFEMNALGATGEAFSRGLLDRLLIAGHIPFFYLKKLLYPYPTVFFYPRWEIDPAQWVNCLPLVSLLFVIVILLVKYQKWGGPLFLGLAAFLISLFPVAGFFNNNWNRFSYVSDHWVHIPSIAILILFVQIGVCLLKISGMREKAVARYFSAAVGGGIIVVLGTLTWQQAHAYKNLETLWQDTIRKNPKSHNAYNRLGSLYFKQGKMDAAIENFTAVIQIRPEFVEPYNNRGTVYLKLQQYDKAIADFSQAIELQPGMSDAYFHRGIIYSFLKQYQNAIADFTKVIQLDPQFMVPYSKRSEAHLYLKHYQQAIEDLNRYLVESPSPGEFFNRGIAHMGLKQNKKAVDDFSKAIEMEKGFKKSYVFRGIAYMHLGKSELACTDWKKSCQLGDCQNFQVAKQKGICSE
ncbi:MAG: tetratricopeptide repeat protein [SAR324 cluster bacterium]|nr:tetratricopeptide repeat protein [SAR324 cluster bacterium]